MASDCSWACIKRGPWSILTHVDTAFQDPRPTHGHHDLFSFDLSAFGVPIIVDPCRSNYAAARDSEEAGILDEWHNTVIVDEARTGFVSRGYMPPKLCKSLRPKPKVEIDDTGLQIYVDSIPTLRPEVSVERVFTGSFVDDLKIKTRLSVFDSSVLRVSQVLYLAGDVRIERGRATIRIAGKEIVLRWVNLPKPVIRPAVRYVGYAHAESCTRLEWSSEVLGPHWESEFCLSVNQALE